MNRSVSARFFVFLVRRSYLKMDGAVKEVRFYAIRERADLEGWTFVLRKDDMVVTDIPHTERFFAILRSDFPSTSILRKEKHHVELKGKELKIVLDELLEDAENALLESELLKEEMESLSPRSKELRREKEKYKRRSHFRQSSKDGATSPLSPLSEDDYGDSPIPHDMFDDLDTTLDLFKTVEASPRTTNSAAPATQNKNS